MLIEYLCTRRYRLPPDVERTLTVGREAIFSLFESVGWGCPVENKIKTKFASSKPQYKQTQMHLSRDATVTFRTVYLSQEVIHKKEKRSHNTVNEKGRNPVKKKLGGQGSSRFVTSTRHSKPPMTTSTGCDIHHEQPYPETRACHNSLCTIVWESNFVDDRLYPRDGKFLRLFNAMGNNWEFQVRRANVRFESGKDSESFEYVPYDIQLALKVTALHAISTLQAASVVPDSTSGPTSPTLEMRNSFRSSEEALCR